MTEKQLDACISEVLSKFQSASGVQFQLKEQQVTAVKNRLLNHDVLAVLPTGYGKTLIFQSFVVAKELLENAKACVVVICPLSSIIEDQIANVNVPRLRAVLISRDGICLIGADGRAER
ncbi:uncharacterized protein [Montipora capricornis]|uniref:uncharacterized protein n=1 Tax=Montipora foliosa TaxID=591990 RepID=UPI0035F13107